MNTAPASSAADNISGTNGHAFRSGRRSASDANGVQAQLDSLARAGVVTHVVGHGEAIDPLFAVAQLRDLPEVRFVAAFREGVIALGCPGGLPEQLQNLAAPISIPNDAATPPAQDGLQTTLDKIAERLAQLEGPAGMGALNERLTALDTISVETVRLIGDLTHSGGPNRNAFNKDDLVSALADPIRALQAEQENGLNRVSIPLAEILQRLQTVEQQIEDARRDAVSANESADTLGTAQVGTAVDAIPLIAEGLQRIEEQLAGAVSQGSNCFDDLKSQLNLLLDRTDASAQENLKFNEIRNMLETLRSDLDKGTQRESKSSEEIKILLHALALPKQSEEAPMKAIEAQLVDIGAQLNPVSAVMPKLDEMIEQLDKVMASVTQPTEANCSLNDGVHEKLETILDVLRDTSGHPDKAAFITALDGLKENSAERGAVLSAIGQLHECVTSLVTRPDPVLDLTAQRQSFAQFGTVMKMIVQRLEGSTDQIKECVSNLSAPQLQKEHATDSTTGTESAQIAEEMGALRVEMSSLASKYEQIDEINTTINALANRPKPIVDLSEQRRSFAGFTSALATIIQRLEHTAELFSAPTQSPLPDAGESLTTLISNLPEQIANRLPQSLDADQLVEKLSAALAVAKPNDQLLAEIRQIAESFQATPAALGPEPSSLESQLRELAEAQQNVAPRLETLSNQIGAMQASKVPVLDLTEQRASFAMFGTALAAVVGRLENAISRTSQQTVHDDVSAKLALLQQEMADLTPQTDEIKHAIGSLLPLAELPQQFAQMSEQMRSQTAPHVDLTVQHQSFARFATASQQVITRLESAIETLSAIGIGTHAPLAAQVEHLSGEVKKLSLMHEDTTASMISFLEIIVNESDAETNNSTEMTEMPENVQSMEVLRTFDEELQIRTPEANEIETPATETRTADLDDHCFQSFDTETIKSELEDVTDTKSSHPPVIPEANHIYRNFRALPAPMEDLRFCFAEVIASQLRETHQSTKNRNNYSSDSK